MVTINKAISRGHLMVTMPVVLIFVGFPLFYFYLQKNDFITVIQKNILIISSFLLAWIYWSFFIVKWKLWAYKNVEELDELKLIAAEQGLIWKDGSIFEKTEIKTKSEREQLNYYEDIFYNKTEFKTNDKTVLYFSKSKLIINILLVFPFFLFGIFIVTISKKSIPIQIFGIVCSLLFGTFSFINIKNLLNRKPQLIISKNGIELNNGKVYSWEEINNEEIICETNKTTLYFLAFNHWSGSEKILLNDLTTNEIQIEKLIEKYRNY